MLILISFLGFLGPEDAADADAFTLGAADKLGRDSDFFSTGLEKDTEGLENEIDDTSEADE